VVVSLAHPSPSESITYRGVFGFMAPPEAIEMVPPLSVSDPTANVPPVFIVIEAPEFRTISAEFAEDISIF